MLHDAFIHIRFSKESPHIFISMASCHILQSMLKILWFAFVFRSIFSPIQRFTPVYNAKITDTVAKIASQLNPALSIVVDPTNVEKRIDSYLATAYPKFSRTYITDLINNGHAFVNNIRKKPSYRLRNNDVVQIMSSENEGNKSRGENLKLDVLYEDDYMMVINKAPGMVVHPGAGCPNETVANAVEFYISNKTKNVENISSINSTSADDHVTSVLDSLQSTDSFGNHIVHRLDKGSSGVLLIGKNKRMTSLLSQQFASRDVVKYYLAVCVGNPGDTTIAKSIGRSLTDRKKMSVIHSVGQGKTAVSHVVSLLFDGQLSVAMVRIDTGRTHQIRVHMKQRRTPILGDDQYGSNKWNRQLIHGNKGVNKKDASSQVRTQLHAYETHFSHPVTGERLSVRAPLPPDITTLINRIAMKNMCASSALPLFFFSPNRTEEQMAVRKVTDELPHFQRDSDRMIESRQEMLHRKLLGVVNKTSGFLQGNTDNLYASLQRFSDQYREQQDLEKGVKKVVSAHGYVGNSGFYVAEDTVRPALDVAKHFNGGDWNGEEVEEGEVNLDEVWGEYEEDERGGDGHKVSTGEKSYDADEGGEGGEGGGRLQRGGFAVEEEEGEEGDMEQGGERFGFTVDEYEDDDEEDSEENNDSEGEEEEEEDVYEDEDISQDSEEKEEEDDDDDWSVESIASSSRGSSKEKDSDGYDEDDDEVVDFSAVKHWR